VLGRGRTGSGKTYAFLLPLVARLSTGRSARPRTPRALVLAPTRELVGQIEASLAPLAQASGLSYVTVYGGVSQHPQVSALSRGVDIVIACPGRLEDLIGQKHCSLADVQITVLDEADHMADLGFLPAVRRLLNQTPRGGQRLLFSATLDQAIDTLVRQFLTRPVTHQADSVQSPVSAMSHHILHIEREHRLSILLDLTSAPGRTVVFTRTKHGAQGLARQLNRGGVPAVDLHGNLGQNARTRNLDAFHAGNATVLVATDIAARGIHVDDVTLVVHADPPAEHKAYLHRSGRTARAGNAGTVVTLMTGEQAKDVRDLVRAAGIAPITTRIKDNAHPILAELAPGDRALRGPFQPSASTEPGPHPAQQSPKARQHRRRSARGTSQASTTNPRARASSTSKHATGEKVVARSGGSRRSTARTSTARHSAAAFSAGRR
jgi:superfamily II DNA/RNA helicase